MFKKLLLFLTIFICFSMIFIFLSQDNCLAADKNTIDEIAEVFYQKSSQWTSKLEKYALDLFRMLVILEIVMFGIKAVLNRSDMHDVISQFVMTMLFAAFIYTVIKNYSDWAWQIIDGFKFMATDIQAGSSINLGPFKTGLKIMEIIIGKVSIFSPVDSLGYLVCGLIVLICFSLITAQVLMIKCEAYIAVNASVVLLGFGGSAYFKEYAINTMRYVLSVAFKLFVMQLVLGLGLSFILDMETTTTAENTSVFVTIGVSIVLLALVKSLPDVAAGIINGSHVGSGTTIMSTGAAMMGAAFGGAMGAGAAASGSMDAVKNIKAATSLAGEQGHSGMGKAAGTMGNLWGAHQDTRSNRATAMHSNLQGKISGTKVGTSTNTD